MEEGEAGENGHWLTSRQRKNPYFMRDRNDFSCDNCRNRKDKLLPDDSLIEILHRKFIHLSKYAYWHIRTHNLNCRRWIKWRRQRTNEKKKWLTRYSTMWMPCQVHCSCRFIRFGFCFCFFFFHFLFRNANYMLQTCEYVFESLHRWLSAWKSWLHKNSFAWPIFIE